jgi:hypothetical protein
MGVYAYLHLPYDYRGTRVTCQLSIISICTQNPLNERNGWFRQLWPIASGGQDSRFEGLHTSASIFQGSHVNSRSLRRAYPARESGIRGLDRRLSILSS